MLRCHPRIACRSRVVGCLSSSIRTPTIPWCAPGASGFSYRAAASSNDATTAPSPFSAIASQTNGLQHGHTIYGVHRDDTRNPPDAFQIQRTHEHVLRLRTTAARVNADSTHPSAATTPAGGEEADGIGRGLARLWTLTLRSTERTLDVLSDLFLPRDFRRSVTRDYFPYAKWYFIGTVASAATGVLSMQSLLYAVGLGAGAIPTAAAVNWVLKDGLGQFGGVLFASVVNNRYDADPKRWRVASAVALDAAVLIEILTPLFPGSFLAMASIGNVAKNISWLSASATRAGFHNSFALRENLADVTAKAGSQAIASSILGTGLGIAISQLTGPSTEAVLVAFAGLSCVHQLSVYRALASVSLRTLNCQRLHLVLEDFLNGGATAIPHQETVGQREQFIPTLLTGYESLYPRSTVNGNASLADISRDKPAELLRLREFFQGDRYLLNVNTDNKGKFRIDLALDEEATSPDALRAHLHAVLIQREIENSDGDCDIRQICRGCYSESQRLAPTFLTLLQGSEWHTENLLIEEKGMRYKWLVKE